MGAGAATPKWTARLIEEGSVGSPAKALGRVQFSALGALGASSARPEHLPDAMTSKPRAAAMQLARDLIPYALKLSVAAYQIVFVGCWTRD